MDSGDLMFLFKNANTFLLLAIICTSLNAQPDNVLEIRSIRKGQIKNEGFVLNSSKEIKITARGAGSHKPVKKIGSFQVDPSGMFVYAWILDAKTRNPVWYMTVENTEELSRSRLERSFDKNFGLPAGEYEVYFTAQTPYLHEYDDGFFSLGKLLDKLLRGDDSFEHSREDWFVTIENINEVSNSGVIEKYHKARKSQAVFSLTNIDDSDFLQYGFTLKEKGEFDIYGIGEAFEGEEYDYGWIVGANNSDKVWEMIYEYSEHAGGAIKNRVWRDRITLEPGDYWVYYVSDGSHSPGNWNANPPYDPYFYGITMTGVPGKFNPKSIQELIKQKINPILQIIRVGDDELIGKGFELKDELKIRIHALGEGRDGEMFDYGWIEDLTSGKTVWKMEYDNTRHAGGGDKNRMVDEIISLPRGSYMIYYKTDGSHSYRRWNVSKPYEPENWGIIIYPADVKYNEENIKKLREDEITANVVARIVRVKDEEHIRKNFILAKDSDLRIYAIGEGSWDEMYDYGWIEGVDEGNIVWEMTYENTRWAGGAKKNRMVETMIHLKAGEYELNFVTDNSHSFNDWNTNPPNDPVNYGISVYMNSN
jgi:hypothetical protein